MAARSAPETSAVADNEAVNEDPTLEDSKIYGSLLDADFNAAVRFIKTGRLERVQHLATALRNHMISLSIAQDLTRNVSGIPTASDQIDLGSLLSWIASIASTDTSARDQLTR